MEGDLGEIAWRRGGENKERAWRGEAKFAFANMTVSLDGGLLIEMLQVRNQVLKTAHIHFP